MVFVNVPGDIAASLAEHLQRHGIVITGMARQRWVTHLDVMPEDVDAAMGVVDRFFAE